MSTIPYYLSHVVPIVLILAAVFFLLGIGFGWLAWGAFPRQVVQWEEENDQLRSELRHTLGT